MSVNRNGLLHALSGKSRKILQLLKFFTHGNTDNTETIAFYSLAALAHNEYNLQNGQRLKNISTNRLRVQCNF